jgi:hypothetical protein
VIALHPAKLRCCKGRCCKCTKPPSVIARHSAKLRYCKGRCCRCTKPPSVIASHSDKSRCSHHLSLCKFLAAFNTNGLSQADLAFPADTRFQQQRPRRQWSPNKRNANTAESRSLPTSKSDIAAFSETGRKPGEPAVRARFGRLMV